MLGLLLSQEEGKKGTWCMHACLHSLYILPPHRKGNTVTRHRKVILQIMARNYAAASIRYNRVCI